VPLKRLNVSPSDKHAKMPSQAWLKNSLRLLRGQLLRASGVRLSGNSVGSYSADCLAGCSKAGDRSAALDRFPAR
jgi:hypothetical protein